MNTFTAEKLAAMRANRLKRINAVKSELKGDGGTYLLIENLAKKSSIWRIPDTSTEIRMRFVDFEVTKENNIGGNEVGTLVATRTFKVHRLANGRTVVCPSSFGMECPMCRCYAEHKDEVLLDRNSPYNKFKAKEITLANAVMQIPQENGKTKTEMHVICASHFLFFGNLESNLADEVKFNKEKEAEIYAFSDLEIGYWMSIRFGKKGINGGKQEFPQLLHVTQFGYNEPAPVYENETVMAAITDLDLLIPEPATAEELKKYLPDSRLTTITTESANTAPVKGNAQDTADADDDDFGMGGTPAKKDEIPMEYPKAQSAPAKSEKKAKKKEEPKPEAVKAEDTTEVDDLDVDGESADTEADDDWGDL